MITQERLKEYLSYDPETGYFTWIKFKNARSPIGSIAGCPNNLGYIRIRFDSKFYHAHRLAWFYFHGEWPKNEIDHIDGNPSNNKLSNLRDVSPSVNSQNRKKAQAGSKTGTLGVSLNFRRNRYVSKIVLDGKIHYLGTYGTIEEAHAAYLNKKRQIHKGCTI